MNISGPAAVAKPEMLFYAPGDLTVTSVPYKELHPLRRLRVYPSALCGGNSLLMQTISVAKSENPMP